MLQNFIPSIFEHITSPGKQTLKSRASDYHRGKGTKKRRIEKASRTKETREGKEARNREKGEIKNGSR